MDRKVSWWFEAVALIVAMLVLDAGVANATAIVQPIVRTTTTEDVFDIGCHEQDLVHLEGEVTMHEVDVNGGLRIAVTTKGTVSFTEEGESFSGGFERNFTFSLSADGSYVTTQEYTGVLHGDTGDTAILHITAHITFLASSGSLATAFAILHQSCNA